MQAAQCRRLSYFLCRCLFNGRWLVCICVSRPNMCLARDSRELALLALRNLEGGILVFLHTSTSGGDWKAARHFRLLCNSRPGLQCTVLDSCPCLAVGSTQHIWRMRPVSRFCQLQAYYITSPVPRHSKTFSFVIFT